MGPNQFFIDFLNFFEKSIYLMAFKLWDRFWNLPDGPLDPWIDINILKNMKNAYFGLFHIFDPWLAITDDVNL